MAKPDNSSQHKPRRARKPLNAPKIKRAFLLLIGLLTGLGVALTGLGGHLALEPTLEWALGFPSQSARNGPAFRVFHRAHGPAWGDFRRSHFRDVFS